MPTRCAARPLGRFLRTALFGLAGLSACGPGAAAGDAGRTDSGPDALEDAGRDTEGLPHCGNGVLEPDLGEECDDGARQDGDGCDASCRREALYPGFVAVRGGRLTVRKEPVFLIGAAGLPQGATEQEALAAGFNLFLGPGEVGYRVVSVAAADQDATRIVEQHAWEENVIAWLGPDEPAWAGLPADEVRSRYADPVQKTDPFVRPFMLNHAPRGSASQPEDFSQLIFYLALTDVVSMDIYPIPTGNGHSILPAHQGLEAVGAYAEILQGLLQEAGRDELLVMVLQGAGLGHIPGEAWNNLENWQTDEAWPAAAARFANMGDFDGDGVAELAVGLGSSDPDAIVLYDFQEDTWGGRKQVLDLPAELDLDRTLRSAAGDFDGDGACDLALLTDQGPDRQELWVLSGGPAGLSQAQRVLRTSESVFLVQVVCALLAADFDGDGCSDLLAAYDYPDPAHQAWFLLPSGCTDYAGFDLSAARLWYETSTEELDLERLRGAAAGDLDRDGYADLLLVRGRADGTWDVVRLSGGPVGGSSPQALVTGPGDIPAEAAAGLAAGDTDGDGDLELVLALEPSAGETRLLVGPPVTQAFDDLAPWLSAPGTDFDVGFLPGLPAGDLDGDGTADILALQPDPVSGALHLVVAFSTGSDFGARDPLAKEMRFMALDAVAHGAGGVVFWGQSFVDASHVAWERLLDVTGQLAGLSDVFRAETHGRGLRGPFAWRWFARRPEIFLLACHEAPRAGAVLPRLPLPEGIQALNAACWDWSAGAFQDCTAAVIPGGLEDPVPYGPYECRVYGLE